MKTFQRQIKLNSIYDLNLVAKGLNNIIPLENHSIKDYNKATLITKRGNIKNALEPLEKVGSKLREEVLKANSDEKLKSSLINLNDNDIIMLGLISLALKKAEKKAYSIKARNIALSKANIAGDGMPRALHCLASATGISAISSIITGTAELASATTALKILKTVGKRYLGYIGLAFAVYNFTKCISS